MPIDFKPKGTINFKPAEKPREDKEEMPSGVSLLERWNAKNFSKSPEDTLSYFKKIHPELNPSLDNGEVVFNTKEGKRPLDPRGFDLADLGDVGIDVVNGGLQGLATAGGALAGPLGAIGASAASGAGLEALRQGIGNLTGVNDGVNGTDVAGAGVSGAITPLIFGADKLGGGNVIKGAIPKTAEVIKGKVAPWLGEKLTGISKEVIKEGADKVPLLREFESGKKNVLQYANNLTDDVSSKLGDKTDDLMASLRKAYDASGDTMHATDAMEPLLQLESKLAKAKPTPENLSRRAAVKDVLDNFFSVPGAETGGQAYLGELPMGEAASLQRQISQATKWSPDGGIKTTKGFVKPNDELNAALKGVYHQFNEGLEKGTQGASKEIKNQMRANIALGDDLAPIFKSPQSVVQNMVGAGNKGGGTLLPRLQAADKALGTNLGDAAKELSAIRYFAKPSADALSLGGTTSTSRTAGNMALGGIGGLLAANQIDPGNEPLRYVSVGLGGALGAKLMGPAMLRYIMDQNFKTQGAQQAVKQGLKFGGGNAISNMIRNSDKD